MSTLLSALNKTARKNSPRTLRGRANMVGEICAFNEKTITVKVLSGPIKGQQIDIDPGNKKVKEFEKESKAQTSSYTKVGGILRFDGVTRQNDGTYKSTWTNAWIKHPGEDHKLLADQLVSYDNTGRRNSDDLPIVNIHVMDAEKEKQVADFDDLRETLIEGFSTAGAVLVVDTGEGFSSSSYALPGQREGDKFVREDPTEFAQSLIDDILAQEDVKKIFLERMETGNLTIVPVKRIPVGPKSAEEAENAINKAKDVGKKARIMTVNPYAYERPSLGVRLSGALSRTDRDGNLEISEEYAERFKEAFLKSAPQSARDAFMADGWVGVSDTDLKDFLESNGVTLMKLPKTTWNTASIHLQRFTGSDNFFAAKTHEAYRYGTAIPPLECTKEIRAAFASEMQNAVLAVVKAPVAEAETKDDAPAASEKEAETAAEADAEAEAQAALEEADIDSMLGEIADEPMA